MSKNMTIKLAYLSTNGQFPWPDGKPRWKVLQVTDSIAHHPGECLEKAMVRDLCEFGMWKVTIVGGENE